MAAGRECLSSFFSFIGGIGYAPYKAPCSIPFPSFIPFLSVGGRESLAIAAVLQIKKLLGAFLSGEATDGLPDYNLSH